MARQGASFGGEMGDGAEIIGAIFRVDGEPGVEGPASDAGLSLKTLDACEFLQENLKEIVDTNQGRDFGIGVDATYRPNLFRNRTR